MIFATRISFIKTDPADQNETDPNGSGSEPLLLTPSLDLYMYRGAVGVCSDGGNMALGMKVNRGNQQFLFYNFKYFMAALHPAVH